MRIRVLLHRRCYFWRYERGETEWLIINTRPGFWTDIDERKPFINRLRHRRVSPQRSSSNQSAMEEQRAAKHRERAAFLDRDRRK